MRNYLRLWLTLTGALLLLTAAFNFLVDPYGLFRFADSAGFNEVKPKAGRHEKMVKAVQVQRIQPRGLILGNSRAEVGFDPLHPAWPVQPVYNLALPGTGTHTSLLHLRQLLAANNKPEVLVWGLDFMDFLVEGSPSNPARPRLPDEEGRLLQQIKDHAETTLTLTALQDSIQTIFSQHSPYAADLTRLGFNPMRDYLKITDDEGYRAVFRQKDVENTRNFLRRPKSIFDSDRCSSSALEDVREVIRLCHEHNIDLRLVIYPYHAHLLEIIRISGLMPAFEEWKRALVSLNAGPQTVPLWDFSRISEITAESIPSVRQEKMRWYWEAGHFKRELGDRVLNRVFDAAGQPPGFGILLRPDNLDAQLSSDRIAEADYRHTHLEDVKALDEMYKNARNLSY